MGEHMQERERGYRITCVQGGREWQAALAIRLEVFCGEQGIPEELEVDAHESKALHLLAWMDGSAVATGRLSIDGARAEIARIAVLPEYRGRGIGAEVVRRLEEEGIRRGVRRFELTPHRHLHSFYTRLGYSGSEPAGEIAGHPLIRMCKEL